MAVTGNDADARDAQDAAAPRAPMRLDGTQDDAVLAVFRTAEWIPPAYRQAYLDGAASVLGAESLVES